MRFVVAMSFAFGLAGSRPNVVEKPIAIPAGVYSYSEIAERLSTPDHPLRAGKDVAQRAAYLSIHARPRAEVLEILQAALGLEINTNPNERVATLVQSSKLLRQDRVWRGRLFERLRSDVALLLRTVSKVHLLNRDDVDQALQADRDAFAKSLIGLPADEKERRMQQYVYTSPLQRAPALDMENSQWSATRDVLARILSSSSASLLTSDNRPALLPIEQFGPSLKAVMTAFPDISPQCLFGWQASLSQGTLRLDPFVNLVSDRFAEISRAPDIGTRLPGEPEAADGPTLVPSLFGDAAVLGRDAAIWQKKMDEESARFLSSADGRNLESRLVDPEAPYLSQALASWSKIGDREVAVELSPAAEQAQEGTTPEERYPNWRFRLVDGVLAPVDLLGFWRRGRPVPLAAFFQAFGRTFGPARIAGEEQFVSFYRQATPAPYDWSDSPRSQPFSVNFPQGEPPPYYGVRLCELQSGWPSFRCWSSLRSILLPKIRAESQGQQIVPLSRLSLTTLRDLASDFRGLYPRRANFLSDGFEAKLAQGSLSVKWNGGDSGTIVVLSVFFRAETMAESMASNDLGSNIHFRLRP